MQQQATSEYLKTNISDTKAQPLSESSAFSSHLYETMVAANMAWNKQNNN
jgi:hypothetical protein